jgi:hypothetical protein
MNTSKLLSIEKNNSGFTAKIGLCINGENCTTTKWKRTKKELLASCTDEILNQESQNYKIENDMLLYYPFGIRRN